MVEGRVTRSLSSWLLSLYAAGVVGELYFFLWQRAALELCRLRGLPDDSRFALLPPAYRLAWLFRGAKWLALILLFLNAGWGVALVGLVVPWLLAAIVPVPHDWFSRTFR